MIANSFILITSVLELWVAPNPCSTSNQRPKLFLNLHVAPATQELTQCSCDSRTAGGRVI